MLPMFQHDHPMSHEETKHDKQIMHRDLEERKGVYIETQNHKNTFIAVSFHCDVDNELTSSLNENEIIIVAHCNYSMSTK